MHASSDVQLVIPSSRPHGHRCIAPSPPSSLHGPRNHHTSHRLDILAASLPKNPQILLFSTPPPRCLPPATPQCRLPPATPGRRRLRPAAPGH
uniref:Uncharacterized protein n=1 Tax=Oryza rufipogon TaxID=4529 RepID=A0A0E0NSP2_ORYRU